MNLNSWKNHWFSGVFAEEIQKGIDCFKTLISLFKQKSLGGVMRSLWDLIKTILSFRYFDIILLLILFFKLQEAESYRIARLGELVFEWEQKLPQAAFSDYCILCIPLLFLPRFWRNLYHVVIFCCLLAITIHILLLKTYG